MSFSSLCRSHRSRARYIYMVALICAWTLASWTFAEAHNTQVTTSSGTSTYSTGHGHYDAIDTNCGGTWSNNHRDNITQNNTSSLTFNSFNTYIYNLSGSLAGGPYRIVDNKNGTSRLWGQYVGWAFSNGNTYSITTGYTVGSASNLLPYSEMYYYPGGGSSAWCEDNDLVLYQPT